jgi:putative transposase
VDDYTRECLAIEVDASLPGERVVRVLDRLVGSGHKPEVIVLDNGPEFAGRVLDTWAVRNKVQLRFIDPGKPIQNAYIESFNARLRDECLNQHWFVSLDEARAVIEEWREDYNRKRPHGSLDNQTPEEFAGRCRKRKTGSDSHFDCASVRGWIRFPLLTIPLSNIGRIY